MSQTVIKSIDTSAAEMMRYGLTGADFADVGGNPAGW
jgi:carbon-monoxide dehydrogenase large subunit